MSFHDNSKACKKAIRRAQEKWLYAVGELLVSAIRPLIPVDTSSLKTSLDYKVDIDKMEVIIGVGEHYAMYVEFGTGEYAENGQGRKGGWMFKNYKTGDLIFTRGGHPKPYMRPGFRSQKQNVKALLEKYLKEIGVEASVSFKKK
ncbi:HK97 gp10 family phage protein [Clostridium sp. SYSU_GA19001]|uniref:HK97 gp10 family phage protein n=1 Tax=Clostridium caldaquaticum TaxID=2940653 RepID=UPI002077049F|nr:HK97 gp10 family phage protein [Clostridium caldaquaticum]MCM8710538.1 HK97 gp10 family phage protein [Clostridium caldaquaticum]